MDSKKGGFIWGGGGRPGYVSPPKQYGKIMVKY